MSLGVTIDATGISAPSFADILTALINSYQSIYGSDAVLTPDTQDGQFLSVLAEAINDVNQGCIATYNSFSPATAQGAGLSNDVLINGLRRKVPSASTVTLTIVGVAQTIITGGLVGDNLNLGTQWALPATVTIPGAGTINVVATSTTLGAVAAAPATLTVLLTPTIGWQTSNNVAAATPGQPVETDSALRQRQAVSVSTPAQAIVTAIFGAIDDITGVGRLAVYENSTGSPDSNGVPGHSISAVVEGGDPIAIATAIALRKTPGTGTYGTTSETIIDQHGVSNVINFFQVAEVTVTVHVTIQHFAGYTTNIGTEIINAIIAFVDGLSVGETCYLNRLFGAAGLFGSPDSQTFVITALLQSRPSNAPPAAQDVPIAFNEAATITSGTITLTVT